MKNRFMPWCFAIVNNKLSEIYFREMKGRPKIIGHCYIKKEEYKTKQEKKWIKEDIAEFRFAHSKGKYKRI